MTRALKILGIGPQEPWPATDGGREGIHGAIASLARHARLLYICPGNARTAAADAHYASIGVDFRPVPFVPAEGLAFILRSTAALRPFKFHKYGTPRFAELADAEIGDFEPDVIVCFHAHMFELGLRLKQRRNWSAPIILREHNIEYEMLDSFGAALSPPARLLLKPYASLTRRSELQMWRGADAVAFLTDRDFQTAHASGVRGRFVLAPEGVPIPPLRAISPPPGPVLELLMPLNPKAAQSAANASRFLREYWSPLAGRDDLQAFRVAVTGADPSRLAEVCGIDPVDQSRLRIEALGFLPSLLPAFERAFALICPTFYGAGIRKKMLEGMANQVPVVATDMDIRTCSYLADGQNILALGTPGEFAQTLLRLRDEPGRWTHIASQGRQAVEDHAQWENFARILIDEMHALLQRPAVAGAGAS